jgi:hypothetical protein
MHSLSLPIARGNLRGFDARRVTSCVSLPKKVRYRMLL